MVATSDLAAQLRTATLIAAEAAELALLHRLRGVETLEKGPRDLVTEADRAVEALVAQRLAQAFPDDLVVGEEGTGAGQPLPPGLRCWYVDPIDGTTNYLKGLPTWGVSIGLADGAGDLLLGVIAMPAAGEVFTAARGHGAQRNGVPITCSTEARLDRTLIAHAHSSRSAERWGGAQPLRAAVGALMAASLGTRMQGCSVADLTSVATGRIDAAFVGGMHPWDVAAGLLIAREAGVVVTTPDGSPATGPATAFLASPAAVHHQIRDLLAEHGAVLTS